MKIYIGPYRRWFGPHQLADFLCFWTAGKLEKPNYVHKFGEWLAHGSIEPEPEIGEIRTFGRSRHNTLLYRFLLWLDRKKERKIQVKIHDYDVWNMNMTLAHIILPMLRKMKDEKHGAPWVEDEDVPEELKSTSAEPKEHEFDIDDNHFKRWDYVLDEMIFAFESELDDTWQDQFYVGKGDLGFKRLENGYSELVSTGEEVRIDTVGLNAYQDRIKNGHRLFGKYYQSLWT